MFLESLRQDLRIGLRVLLKEKSFCALAVTVIALGICGVTTMFSVVNGVLLRGFDFPTAGRLTSIQFIDPAQTNFFGVANQIYALDYEEMRASQKSAPLLACTQEVASDRRHGTAPYSMPGDGARPVHGHCGVFHPPHGPAAAVAS